MLVRRRRGFTLVELLIILGLLGSIITIAAPSIFGVEGKAKTEACQDQMDFIVNGFQTEQFNNKSPYAFDTLADGEIKLNAYIAKAIDSSEYINIGFNDQVICPSDRSTAYEAASKDGQLYVYCLTHKVYSHGSLSPRPSKTESTKYTAMDGWTAADNNWIVGDHESFFVLPIESQYYHMEIGFQLVLYDDGNDDGNDPIYEYQYDDPDWYLEIPTNYYSVKELPNGTTSRPEGYDLATYNATNQDLSFALAIDFQETEGGINFSSNALELKNVNSNALDQVNLDIMKESEFDPELTVNKVHQRDLFDGETDWLLIDIVPKSDTMKTMVVHMMDADNQFRPLFETDVPVADESLGDIKFAFFMGKRSESIDPKLKNGIYYADAYPTPVQVNMKNWEIDYDTEHEESGKPYSFWYSNPINYSGFDTYLP
ncbi:hypothetical protein SANA_31300 [Gottschalkiaceae bacterium SANA]|nr:hypothetical protein SANA_31300 [Gottschalkiaceae bacterium SANA]